MKTKEIHEGFCRRGKPGRATRKLLRDLCGIVLGLITLVVWAGPTVAQTWIERFPTGTPPTARYGLGSGYDAVNDRLIFFSGDQSLAVQYPTDVWVLINATGVSGEPSWLQVIPQNQGPVGRYAGTVAYDPTSNRLIVFGGCAGNCQPVVNQTWVLTHANGLGGSAEWIRLPDAPVYRTEHAAVYDPASNRLIVFAGSTGWFGSMQNDVWILKDANGIGSPEWEQLSPGGPLPPARTLTAAAYDQTTNRMIIFGGGLAYADWSLMFDDVWILASANGLGGTPQWVQLAPSGAIPTARWGHSVAFDPESRRLIVFGGAFDQRPEPTIFFNDVWTLSEANGLGGTPNWTQLAPFGEPPEARAWFITAYSAVANRMVIGMGRNDIPAYHLFNDVWVLADANGIIDVLIDIKPGSFPNSINPKSKGKIPVAILTNATFDATTADPATVRFGKTGTEAVPVHSALEDVDGDGDIDIILHFNTQETGIVCGDTHASLTGETFSRQAIEGSDSVKTAGCK